MRMQMLPTCPATTRRSSGVLTNGSLQLMRGSAAVGCPAHGREEQLHAEVQLLWAIPQGHDTNNKWLESVPLQADKPHQAPFNCSTHVFVEPVAHIVVEMPSTCRHKYRISQAAR